MQRLGGVGDHAGPVEVDKAVREHLRVYAEVVLVPKGDGDGVRYAADAELERGFVLYEVGDELPDFQIELALRPLGHVEHLVGPLIDTGGLADMDVGVAEGAGHVFVYLKDYYVRVFDHHAVGHAHGAGGEIAVLVHGGDLYRVDYRPLGAAAPYRPELVLEALAEVVGDKADRAGLLKFAAEVREENAL